MVEGDREWYWGVGNEVVVMWKVHIRLCQGRGGGLGPKPPKPKLLAWFWHKIGLWGCNGHMRGHRDPFNDDLKGSKPALW
jgi:hypothetical protein